MISCVAKSKVTSNVPFCCQRGRPVREDSLCTKHLVLSLRLSWADVTKWILASLAVNYFLNMLHGHTVISITASLGIVFEFLHARTLDVTLEDTNQAGCVSLRQSAASYNTLIVSSVFIHNGSYR